MKMADLSTSEVQTILRKNNIEIHFVLLETKC